MYSRFCRQTMWDHVLTATAVTIHGTVLARLFFTFHPVDTVRFSLAIFLSYVVAGAVDYVISLGQLLPLRRYLTDHRDGDAQQAAAVLYDWPTRVAVRVFWVRLPVFTLVLLASVYAAEVWSHTGVGIADLTTLLLYFPLGAAPYAILIYFFAAAAAADALAEVTREHPSVVHSVRPEYRRFNLLVGVALFLMAALPLGQMVFIARIHLNGMSLTPQVEHLTGLILWGLLIGLMFIAAAVYLFVRVVLAPVRRVSQSMRALADGDPDVRVTVPAWGELGALTGGFNAMALSIQAQQQQLKQVHLETVRALSVAIEARDPYTQGHSHRVGALAVKIAGELGWTEEQQNELMVAGVLHDIGKIGIPEAVLLKNGPLSADDWRYVKRHPEIGYQIASQAKGLSPYLNGIRQHHERLDGSGYPDGLKGDQIYPCARVLAVADVWDALTSDRPYRPGMTLDQALSVIVSEAERNRLDPNVVEALRRVVVPN